MDLMGPLPISVSHLYPRAVLCFSVTKLQLQFFASPFSSSSYVIRSIQRHRLSHLHLYFYRRDICQAVSIGGGPRKSHVEARATALAHVLPRQVH